MKGFLTYIIILISIISHGQTGGHVYFNADGTLRVNDNAIQQSKIAGLSDSIAGKLSASNIKTINGNSIVGTGNLILDGVGVSLLDVYPVGSIYISVNSTNPASLFGGTWVAFGAGRTLIGVDAGQTEFDTVEETGGAKTKTLTASEMPAHTHNIPDVRSATTGTATTQIARTGDTSSTAGSDVSTASAGSGSAFSILNPYISVFFWKRTN